MKGTWVVPQGYSISDIVEELGVEIVPIPQIPTALNAANARIRKKGLGPVAEEEEFRTLISAILHFQKLKSEAADQLWDTMDRGYRDQNGKPDQNVLLKSIFLSCQLMDQTMKKSSTKLKDVMIEGYIKRWITHLRILRGATLESHEAASLISGVCWSVLGSIKKQKSMRDDLTTIISKVIKIVGTQEVAINVVKLIRTDASLADFFAERIVIWTTQHDTRGLVNSILCEINEIKETKSQAGIVTFIGCLAKRRPEEFIRHFSMVQQLIDESDSKYWVREACISTMAEIFKFKSNQEDLERANNFDVDDIEKVLESSQLNDSEDQEKEDMDPRTRSFQILTEHIYDRNGFTRSFTLRTFEKLSTEVRLPHLGDFLERIVGRFEDNSSAVRKSAIQAFSSIISNHILLDSMRNIKALEDQVESTEDQEQKVHLSALLRDTEKVLEQIKRGSSLCIGLLNSTLLTDTCEAIKWFYRVTTLQLRGADLDGFRQMAVHVWSKEEKIRNQVLECYKDIYFNDSMSHKNTALGLIYLVKDSSYAEANSIAKMVQLIKIPPRARDYVWKLALGRADEKLPPILQASAMAIIEMMSKSDRDDVLTSGNIDAFVSMLRDTTVPPILLTEICNILTNIRPNPKKPLPDGAFARDDPIFEALEQRLYDLIKTETTPELVNLFNAAIRVCYYLSAAPTELVSALVSACFQMAIKRLKKAQIAKDPVYTKKAMGSLVLALTSAGHHALNLSIWAECTVVPKMTGKDSKKKGDKTPKNDEEIDDMFGNVDDVAYEEESILRVLDRELTRGPFASITNMARTILAKADQWPSSVQCAAVGCLMKFMAASPTHAEEKASLIFTILSRGDNVAVEQTILSGYPDLLVRHPNIMEPWTSLVFDKLEDDDDVVRQSTLTMISDLIVKDLVKPRGRLYQVARLVLDENESIAREAKTFFVEFSSHGTKLINHLPDILAKLQEIQLSQCDFRDITLFLFDQLSGKEKQTEQLVEKLCSRFREQDADDTWKQVALTLSVMPTNERMIKKLIECAFMFQDKLGNLEIRDNLLMVCQRARENTKLMTKATKEVEELEMVLTGDKTVDIPATPKKQSARSQVQVSQTPRRKKSKPKPKISWSSDEEDEETPTQTVEEVIPQKRQRKSRR